MWGVRDVAVERCLKTCSMCERHQVDLRHVLGCCPRANAARDALSMPAGVEFMQGLFTDEVNLDKLRVKVQYVGQCFVTVLANLSVAKHYRVFRNFLVE